MSMLLWNGVLVLIAKDNDIDMPRDMSTADCRQAIQESPPPTTQLSRHRSYSPASRDFFGKTTQMSSFRESALNAI
jgi:hypothetical protein